MIIQQVNRLISLRIVLCWFYNLAQYFSALNTLSKIEWSKEILGGLMILIHNQNRVIPESISSIIIHDRIVWLYTNLLFTHSILIHSSILTIVMATKKANKGAKADEDETTLRIPGVLRKKCESNAIPPSKILKDKIDEAIENGKL